MSGAKYGPQSADREEAKVAVSGEGGSGTVESKRIHSKPVKSKKAKARGAGAGKSGGRQGRRGGRSGQERTGESRAGQSRTGGSRARQEIAYQNKDITSKVLAEHLKGKSFEVYGLNIPGIRQVLPTNLPVVKANELRMDNPLLQFAGRENRIKTGITLACKTVFIRFSTSGEHPMLLVRRKPDKKMPP